MRTQGHVLANQVLSLLWRPSGLSEQDWKDRVQAAIAAMMEFKP